MKLKFVKMHGCGNDYVYIDCFNQSIDNPNDLAIKISNRHFGVGGDGLILVCPSDCADGKMRMFNNDGSEGKMCGNGVRCVGKLLYDNKHIANKPDTISVETLSGIKYLSPTYDKDNIITLKVDMGKAILAPEQIPVNSYLLPNSITDKIINIPYKFGNHSYNINCVSMGNPHCVIFTNKINNLNLELNGPLYENDNLFPERVNTEFAEIVDKHTINMRVWERGSGETLACGTGACAVAVAACENGFFSKGDDITIKLKGGNLIVNYTDEAVYMTGEAVTVFNGEINI